MNSPTRYRAWDTKANSWTEPHHIAIDGNGDLMNAFSGEYLADQSRWIICHAVGRQDKNDIEIFKGDILEYQFDLREEGDASELYIVKWHKNGFVAAWQGDPELKNLDNDGLVDTHKDMAVIGNRFENPGLLVGLS